MRERGRELKCTAKVLTEHQILHGGWKKATPCWPNLRCCFRLMAPPMTLKPNLWCSWNANAKYNNFRKYGQGLLKDQFLPSPKWQYYYWDFPYIGSFHEILLMSIYLGIISVVTRSQPQRRLPHFGYYTLAVSQSPALLPFRAGGKHVAYHWSIIFFFLFYLAMNSQWTMCMALFWSIYSRLPGHWTEGLSVGRDRNWSSRTGKSSSERFPGGLHYFHAIIVTNSG